MDSDARGHSGAEEGGGAHSRWQPEKENYSIAIPREELTISEDGRTVCFEFQEGENTMDWSWVPLPVGYAQGEGDPTGHIFGMDRRAAHSHPSEGQHAAAGDT